MGTVKHSDKRDALIEELCSRTDHPTADELYFSLKKKIPNLSIATVYRNLAFLYENKQALRFHFNGTDHFDGNTSAHYHLFCDGCGRIYDVDIEVNREIEKTAEKSCGGKITEHNITFFGKCNTCAEKI